MWTRDTLKQCMDKVVDAAFSMDYTWDWPAGVAFYGVARAWEATGDESYATRVREWVDRFIEKGLPPFTVNVVSMGHVLISLYELTKEEKYLELVRQKAEYLTNEAVRFGDGVFQHTVSQNYYFPEQAWADTMFMAAYFLLRAGKVLDNPAYTRDGEKQYYWHIEYLQDKRTQTFYHAWDNVAGNHMSGIHWARANGWAAITMAEALRYADAFNPMSGEIDGALRDQLSALVRLQADDGLWHTVLDDKSSYTEVSASAAIGTALKVYGDIMGYPLYSDQFEKTLCGVLASIDEDGRVHNVSAGTAVMNDAEGYKNISVKRLQGWGQGLALALLAQAVAVD